MVNKKICWLDTETSGLDPKIHDILQISYIIEIDKKVEEKGNFYIQPFNYNTIEKAALEINKLEIAQIKTFPQPQEIYRKIKTILEKYVDRYNKNDKFSLAGYNNIMFDVPFFKQFFIKNCDSFFGSLFDYHTLDVLSLVYILEYKGILNLNNYKLTTVANYFNILFNPHDATEDIRVTREIFYKMLEYIKV